MIRLLVNAIDALGPPDYRVDLLPLAEGKARKAEYREALALAKAEGRRHPERFAGHRAVMLKRANKVIVNPLTGRGGITKTAAYKAWELYALERLKPQARCRVTPDPKAALWVPVIYIPPDRVGLPDLDGAVATMLDLLQHAGAIANDRQVKRLDGSEVRAPDAHAPCLVAWVREIKLYRHGAGACWGTA